MISRDRRPPTACVLGICRDVQDTPTQAMLHLGERLTACGYRPVEWAFCSPQVEGIREKVRQWIAVPECRVLIILGGTGPNPDDVTPEALETILEKRFDGFSTLFHFYSHASAGLPGLLSRALAGIANGTCIIALPASLAALHEVWENVLYHHLSLDPEQCTLVRAALRASKRDGALSFAAIGP